MTCETANCNNKANHEVTVSKWTQEGGFVKILLCDVHGRKARKLLKLLVLGVFEL